MRNGKIFFWPSFLSSIVLILLIVFAGDQLIKPKTTALKEAYPFTLPMLFTGNDNYYFSDMHVHDIISTKKKEVFVFYGNNNDSSKLRILRNEVLKLKYTCDTNRVIRIHFKDAATYGELFQIVRLMYFEKIKRFVLTGNDFYVFATGGDDCVETEPVDSLKIIQPIYL